MTGKRSIFVFLATVFFAVAAFAQGERDAPDYDAWNEVSVRIEQAIDLDLASTRVMDGLRAELVGFRSEFLEAQNVNSSRIRTVEALLESLGPVPEGGENEIVAARRADLRAQLNELRSPVVLAEESYDLANALVGEIDRTLRERKRSAFLARGPTPLNFTKYPAALEEIGRGLFFFAQEIGSAWANPLRWAEFVDNLLTEVLMTILAVLLIFRAPKWIRQLGENLKLAKVTGEPIADFVISLARVAFPVAGLIVLSKTLLVTGIPGLRGSELAQHIVVWGAIILGFRWLAEQVFSVASDRSLIDMSPERRIEARTYTQILALLIVASEFSELLVKYQSLSSQVSAILFFPLVLLAGLIVFRFGVLLRKKSGADVDTEDSSIERSQNALARVSRILGATLMAAGVIAPLLSVFGYEFASRSIIFPTVYSIGLLGLLLTLQRLFADIFGWITGTGIEGRDALAPVLFGFLLSFAAIPLIALFWGASVADLLEWWRTFLQGFSIGGVGISPAGFLTFAALFSIGYMLTRVLQATLRGTLLPRTTIDPGGQNAIVSGLGYVGIFLAGLAAITYAGLDLSSIAIVAGALSVGIGFGLQTIVSNFVSGIILLVERPISEGDWIEVGGQMGFVRNISVRATRIETFDRTDLIVPNSDLVSGTVTNFTRGNTIGRLIVEVGVAYGTDTKRVEKILSEIANSHPMILANPAPQVVFQAFGSDALEFEVRAILRDVTWIFVVKTDINHEIARRFAEEDISIPFAQRDIWLRNPEVLKGVSE